MADPEASLQDKSERLIAFDLFGREAVEGRWHDGAAERGVVRRRTEEYLRLMNGGYRDLVTGRARPRRYVRASRGKPGRDAQARATSSVPPLDPGWFTDPRNDRRRGAMESTGRYLDTKAAADYLGLSPSTLNRCG